MGHPTKESRRLILGSGIKYVTDVARRLIFNYFTNSSIQDLLYEEFFTIL